MFGTLQFTNVVVSVSVKNFLVIVLLTRNVYDGLEPDDFLAKLALPITNQANLAPDLSSFKLGF